MQNTCYRLSKTQHFSEFLIEGLKQELLLSPKPGLVDCHNNGSHADLTFESMNRSIQFLDHFFKRCTQTLEQGGSILDLRVLGSVTEKIMHRQFKTNTHRGAVFLGGLLLAAVHESHSADRFNVSAKVAALSAELFEQQMPIGTTGALVRQQYEVGGIVSEALKGLPTLFQVGVPALKQGMQIGLSTEQCHFLAMAELMCTVEDTTTLKRGGISGLKRIQKDGKYLKTLLQNGEDPLQFLRRSDIDYQRINLTMGGVADLLGMSIAWYLAFDNNDNY